MKKIVVLIVMMLLLCGCSNIQNEKFNDIISSVVTSKYNVHNVSRSGYKYYLPSSMSSVDTKDFNERLTSSKYNYYLYVDVVSYYNRTLKEYIVDDNAYYSIPISYEDKFGYLEINKQDNKKYLVEIMYNYAKIEVMVKECDLKEVVTNAIIILSSINYNNDILASIVGDNALEYSEESFNIFQAKKKESNFLDVQEADVYEETEVVDPDLVD